SGRPVHARRGRSVAVDGRLLADRLELDRRRLFLVPPCLLPDRRERVVGDLEGPLDVFLRMLRAHERALAGVRDAEEHVVPKAMDEPVPPSTRVRTQRVPEVSDLVFRREVDVADRPTYSTQAGMRRSSARSWRALYCWRPRPVMWWYYSGCSPRISR